MFNNPISNIDPDGRIALNVAGATVGFVAGAAGGFATGGVSGAVAGSVAGAFVGAVNPFASSQAGAFAGAAASNLIGQVLGNVSSGRPVAEIDPVLAVASGFGGSTTALAVRGFQVSNVAAQSGIAATSEVLFTVPTQQVSPGPIDFGRVCQ